MKKSVLRSIVVVALLLGLLFVAMSTQQAQAQDPPTTLEVCPTCAYSTIQSAINVIADGGIINVANGTYPEYLIIRKNIQIIGETTDGVIIDASAFGGYGVDADGDYITTFENFTLIGPGSSQGYGLKICGEDAQTTISNVKVKNSWRTGIDLNGLIRAELTNVVLENNGGAGFALTNCSNVTITNITTSDNAWAGGALYTNSTVHTQGSDNISIVGTNNFGENVGFYTQIHPDYPPTNLNTPDFGFMVINETDKPNQTLFARDQANADAIAATMPTPGANVVRNIVEEEIPVTPGMSIKAAIEAAYPGDTVSIAAGTYIVSDTITVDKIITIEGETGAKIQVSGAQPNFRLMAAATLQNLEIEKTDKVGNIIYLGSSGVQILNNEFHGQYTMGDQEVSRAIEVETNHFSDVAITGNTFHHLRQPAYINGTHTGLISNNYVYHTRGWVVAEGNFTFEGNSWGTGADANAVDIAILAEVSPEYYTDLAALAAANNNATIEEQRGATNLLSVAYVDANAAAGGDGTPGKPYQTIVEGIARVVDGGTVHVAAGTYYENVDTGDSIINGLTLRGIPDGDGNYPLVIGSMKFGIPRRADYGQYDHNNLVLENFRIEANLTDTSEYDYGNNVKYRHALMVSNFEGAQLRNLELVSTATNIPDITYGITVHTVAKDYTIENVTIENFELGVYGRADNLTISNSDISRVQSGVNIMSGENLVITDSSIVVEVTNKNRDFYVVRFAESGGPFIGTDLHISNSTLAMTNPNGYGPWEGKYMRSLVLRAAAGGELVVSNSNIPQGVLNLSPVNVNASANWWGSADAPEENDEYVGLVTFCGWRTAAAPDGQVMQAVTNQTTNAVYCSIQEAINAASDYDVLYVGAGTYPENLVINKPLTLNGAGVNSAFGDAPAVVQGLISISASNVTINDMKVAPGNVVGQKAAIHVSASNVTLNRNLIDGMIGDGTKTIKGIHVISGSLPGISDITIDHNVVRNITNPGKGSDGIMVQGVVANVTVSNNTVENIHSDGWAYGIEVTPTGSAPANPPQNVSITGNTIENVTTTSQQPGIGLTIDTYNESPADASQVIVHTNKFIGSIGAIVNKDTAHQLDAAQNYFGGDVNPKNMTLGDILYSPIYIDEEMTTLVNVVNYSGVVESVPGGIQLATPGTRVYLAKDTVIQNNSPCFVIDADDVQIHAEPGAKCIPTGGSHGVEIATGLQGIGVTGLEIDGTGQSTGNGIHVAGALTHYAFLNNRIHNLGGDGIHFAALPGGEAEITGNLFYENGGFGVNNVVGGGVIDAQFNAWGKLGGPVVDTDVSNNVNFGNFTHADLSMISSGPVWQNQVVRGPHTLDISGRPIVLKDGNTYHMWAGVGDHNLYHYQSTDPTFADAVGNGIETTYDVKPFEVGSVTVVKQGNVFYMIAYGSTNTRFNIYTSTDGNQWLNKGLIFDAAGKLTGGKVDAPTILLDGNGSKIYFQYGSPVRKIYMISTTQLLSAIADGNDDEDYTLHATPVLEPTEADIDPNYEMLFHPWAVKVNDIYYMYYTAYTPNAPIFKVRMATSDNGVDWNFHSPNPVMQATSAEPSVIEDNGTWRMYFLSNGGKVGYVSGKGPAEFNETITYTVKANLTNVNGADFTLTYPEELVFISVAGNNTFAVENITHDAANRTIKFIGYQTSTSTVTKENWDILKVNFAGQTTVNNATMDLELGATGGFTTYNTLSSNVVFPMGLVDGTVTVFELPTITSTYADDYYLIGDAQNFTVTINNVNGGNFADTKLQLTKPAGLTLTLQGQTEPLGDTIELGPLASGGSITVNLTGTFSSIPTNPLRFDLIDKGSGFELGAVSSIATVYTKPTITTDGLTGNHNGLAVPFTVTIDNLSDMTPVTFLLDLSFPDGTVISYDGAVYTCDANGCPLIPVTLTVPTSTLDFTAEFPGAYSGNITVTLYDDRVAPVADRELATQEVTGVVVIPNAGTITGTITMQGRTNHAGAVMILTPQAGSPFGPVQATSTNAIGINIQFTNVPGVLQTITTNTPRYLNLIADEGKTIDVLLYKTIQPLRLIGGNAVYTDNVINSQDAGVVGAQYEEMGPQWDGDVNFDGVVDIRDLALVGGNYLLTSVGENSVYKSWNPWLP